MFVYASQVAAATWESLQSLCRASAALPLPGTGSASTKKNKALSAAAALR